MLKSDVQMLKIGVYWFIEEVFFMAR